MRPPEPVHNSVTIAVRIRRWTLAALCVATACCLTARVQAQVPAQNDDAAQNPSLYRSPAQADQLNAHATEQWRQIEQHLPDPATASAAQLEQQADILRARRFPADALEYYNYAIARGGNQPALLNKLGLTELEMHNIELARAYFKRAIKLASHNANAWNNLGAVEYIDRGLSSSISDYKHAIKLNKRQAVFHANLATAYFESKDYSAGRREMATALKLDPNILDQRLGVGGVEAHVLTSEDRARLSYEMARLYASSGQQDQMLHSLAQAAEAGMDIQREMHRDRVLAQYENDPRVVMVVHNARLMRTGHAPTESASSTTTTPPTTN